jgi:hypothetical protein
VRPILIGRDHRPGGFELATKAYCAIADRKRRLSHAAETFRQVARCSYSRVPDLVFALIERREHFVSLGVDHREYGRRRGGPGSKRTQGRDTRDSQAARLREAPGGRDPDSKAGERARTQADRDPVDRVPAPGVAYDFLDHPKQLSRVARAPGWIGFHSSLAGNMAPCGESNAQMRRGGVEAQNPLHELERTVTKASEQGKRAQKREDKEAAKAEQDVTDALEDAQDQAEGDIENPSY